MFVYINTFLYLCIIFRTGEPAKTSPKGMGIKNENINKENAKRPERVL